MSQPPISCNHGMLSSVIHRSPTKPWYSFLLGIVVTRWFCLRVWLRGLTKPNGFIDRADGRYKASDGVGGQNEVSMGCVDSRPPS